jgi:hypothetical protein
MEWKPSDPEHSLLKAKSKDRRKMNKLENELRIQSDPRILGYGDMYESFPRYGRYREELEGFEKQGEYNPDYLKEIPDEILISSLHRQALQSKLESKEL